MQTDLHLVKRQYWIDSINQLLSKRPILWLSGVRRVGKTSLCQSIVGAEYFDCELPSVRYQMADPESFLRTQAGKLIVLDEAHRLDNPAELLKIAADHYQDIRIIATGSSSLSASEKFSDTLSGRKHTLWLTPLLSEEGQLFQNDDLQHRMRFGGLPPFFTQEAYPERDYHEWIEAFWAKDIASLFKIEKRDAFLRFVELLLANSGNIFDANRYATKCGASRTTLINYLSILEQCHIATVLRPFSEYKDREISAAAKVYGFDTGFISYIRGWEKLRAEDQGLLWEHIVLNEIQGKCPLAKLYYWRDKQKHEIDFIYRHKISSSPIAIECKRAYRKFDPSQLLIFRRRYPGGVNFVVAPDIERSFVKTFSDMEVHYATLPDLITNLLSQQ